MEAKKTYIAFFRGINVGGHHKVPMPDLRAAMEELNFENVETVLNSGNVIFETGNGNLEKRISKHLEELFGFPIPTVIIKSETIGDLLEYNPFNGVAVNKDIRLYVSFLGKDCPTELKLPWKSPDNSYTIIERRNRVIFSILDLSISRTIKAMEILEKYYGKKITTRNWNTIERIVKKLEIR